MATTTLSFYRRLSSSLTINGKFIDNIAIFNKDGIIVIANQNTFLRYSTEALTEIDIEGETKVKRKLDWNIKHHFIFHELGNNNLYLNADIIKYEFEEAYPKYKCSDYTQHMDKYTIHTLTSDIVLWDCLTENIVYPTFEERLELFSKDNNIPHDIVIKIAQIAYNNSQDVNRIVRIAQEYKERAENQ